MSGDFDGVAWAYDAFMRVGRFYRDKPVLQALHLDDNQTIADLGGGTGHYAAMLAPRCRKVLVVDESAKMLSRVPRLPNLHTIHADVLATGIEERQCDAALMADVLHHIQDQPALLAEANRILKPGGRAVILDFDARDIRTRLLFLFELLLFGRMRYRTPDETAAMLGEQGFTDICSKRDGWYYLTVGIKA